MLEGAKILLVDIETSANNAWAWEYYDTNLVDLLRDWSILCYGYKWLGGEIEVHSIRKPKDIWDFLKHPDNDKQLVRQLWKLLDEADAVVAHNGKAFDVKKIQSRFLHYGMPPPSPFKVIDTLSEVKRISKNTRNNLDFLLKSWGLGSKLQNEGWPMWKKCMSGDEQAWKEMEAYNEVDVMGLERAFTHLKPWIKSFNLDTYSEKTVCPKCGSHRLVRKGFQYNSTTKYARIKCNDCGGWSRSPVNLQEKRPLISI